MVDTVTPDTIQKFIEAEKEYFNLRDKIIKRISYMANLLGSQYGWRYVGGLSGRLYDTRYTHDWRLLFTSKYGEWYINDISYSSFNDRNFINIHFSSFEGEEEEFLPILIDYLYIDGKELIQEFEKIVKNLDNHLESIKKKEHNRREEAENSAKEARKKLYLELKEEFGE